MADPTPSTEVTTTSFRTKALNAWLSVYAWAKLHPGFMIPAIAYMCGVATPGILKHIF